MSIAENIEVIRTTIAQNSAGLDVKLMAVSKFHTHEEVIEAVKAGIKYFGENRVQEAASKFPDVLAQYPDVELHMIGFLQRNKVKDIVKIASCIQSVDRLELIEEIEKQSAKVDKNIKILFEYHTGEESKSGFMTENELIHGIEAASVCPHIIPAGFMTMAPFTADTDIVKNSFRTLKTVAARMREQFPALQLNELSMGMSGDYKIAIAEGSTLIRIGTAIFGERRKVGL